MANSFNTVDPRCFPFVEVKAQIDIVEQSLGGDQGSISAPLSSLQQLFGETVQVLTWDDWPPERRSLLQSLRVEMHKQLRLLSTDLMFFQTAKQPETLAQRRSDMGDRLINLRGYCDAILKLAAPSPDGTEGSAEGPA